MVSACALLLAFSNALGLFGCLPWSSKRRLLPLILDQSVIGCVVSLGSWHNLPWSCGVPMEICVVETCHQLAQHLLLIEWDGH